MKYNKRNRFISEAVAENIKNNLKNYAKKTVSKMKDKLDKYEDWCLSADDAENYAYIDTDELKQDIKNGLKTLGGKLKKGWEKYKEWAEEGLDAPNPLYWGDDEDETNESLKRKIKESVKRVLKETITDKQLDFYDPWTSGDASYFKGNFDINGYHVEIDDMYNVLINNGEDEYFLQGDEADELIYDMCLAWENNPNKTRNEIIYSFIQSY